MRNRVLYGLGSVILLILAALVVWQGSFTIGPAPSGPGQTLVFWAVSTLIFVLMVTLGFILVRTFVKLWVERRSHREGSRLKTKLVAGALLLSFMPVFFMVLYSFEVMNRNLAKWFTKPVEAQRVILSEVNDALKREMRDKVQAQAMLLASMPETRLLLGGGQASPGLSVAVLRGSKRSGGRADSAGRGEAGAGSGRMPKNDRHGGGGGARAGEHVSAVRKSAWSSWRREMPLDVAAKQR